MLTLLWDQGTSEVELYRSYLHKHSYSDFTFWPRKMDPNEEVSLEERLKSALWLSIGKIVDEETIKLGVNATPQFIGALTEMVWTQIETVSQDLEFFAKHAGRSTINVSDVMLLARRNEGLESILRAFVDQQREEES